MIGLFQYYRIGAAYLILLMHQQFWVTGAFLDGVKDTAVPLFAAMAGYLVWKDDGKVMLGKKVRRTLVPYVIWAVIYFVVNNVLMDVVIKREPFAMPGLRSWILGGVAAHLWFLPCLFMAFVLIGLAMMLKRGWVCVLIVGLLALGIASQALPGETSATLSGYGRIYAGRLLIYFMLGVLLKMFCGHIRVIALCIGGLPLALVGLGNLMFVWWDGLAWRSMALVIGLMMLAVGAGGIKVPRWADKLAKATMGIYLVHLLFTSAAKFGLAKLGYSSLPWYLGFGVTIILYIVSYLAVCCLPKVMRG